MFVGGSESMEVEDDFLRSRGDISTQFDDSLPSIMLKTIVDNLMLTSFLSLTHSHLELTWASNSSARLLNMLSTSFNLGFFV